MVVAFRIATCVGLTRAYVFSPPFLVLHSVLSLRNPYLPLLCSPSPTCLPALFRLLRPGKLTSSQRNEYDNIQQFFFKHEFLQQYRWYWRVEPDIHFHCDIDFDPFVYMQAQNKTYGGSPFFFPPVLVFFFFRFSLHLASLPLEPNIRVCYSRHWTYGPALALSRLHNDCALRSALASAHIMQCMIHDTCVVRVAPHTSPAPAQRSSPVFAPILSSNCLSVCLLATVRRPCGAPSFRASSVLQRHITTSPYQHIVSTSTNCHDRITTLPYRHSTRTRTPISAKPCVLVLVDMCVAPLARWPMMRRWLTGMMIPCVLF